MPRRTKRSGISRKSRRTIKRKTRRDTKRTSRRTIKRKNVKRTKVNKQKLSSHKLKRRNLRGGTQSSIQTKRDKIKDLGVDPRRLSTLDNSELDAILGNPQLIKMMASYSEGFRPPDGNSPFRMKSTGTGHGEVAEQDKKDTQAPAVHEQIKAYWTKQIELQKKHIEELVVNVNLEQIEAERNNLHDQLRALQQNIYLNTKGLKEGQEKIDAANAKLQNYWWNLFNVK